MLQPRRGTLLHVWSYCFLFWFFFFAFSSPKQLHVVNTRAVADKLHKRKLKFVLVGFISAAGLLNTGWVVSDVSLAGVRVQIYLASDSSPVFPAVADAVPLFSTRHPVKLRVYFCPRAWTHPTWASALPWPAPFFAEDTHLFITCTLNTARGNVKEGRAACSFPAEWRIINWGKGHRGSCGVAFI